MSYVFFKKNRAHAFLLETVYTESDKAASENILRLWTDFVKTGNPTPGDDGFKWERCGASTRDSPLDILIFFKKKNKSRVDPANPKRLNLTTELSMMEDSPEFSARLQRWRELTKKFPNALRNAG